MGLLKFELRDIHELGPPDCRKFHRHGVAGKAKKHLSDITPDEILFEDFMKPLGNKTLKRFIRKVRRDRRGNYFQNSLTRRRGARGELNEERGRN